MRTTLTIDSDILERARAIAEKRRRPFRYVINEALRAGLRVVGEPPTARPYRTHPHKMGMKAGTNLDNIQDLFAQIESEDHR